MNNNENMRFPLFVDLNNKTVLVVGGGKIGERRIKTLLSFPCKIKVVSKEVTTEIEVLSNNGKIELFLREFIPSDLNDVFLVTATTNCRKTNHEIAELANEKNIFASISDSPEESSFFFPAVVFQEDTVVGIGSNGKNHHAISELKRKLDNINENKKEV